MNISILLDQYRCTEKPVVNLSEPAVGRTEALRRKFASRLAELSEVRLRAPASESQVAKLSRAAGVAGLPQEVLELYSLADGESTSGFFAPELEFLRVDYVDQLLRANGEAHAMGLLPAASKSCMPIFRDSVGNQLVVMLEPEMRGQIAFINMETSGFGVVSSSTGNLIHRLIRMKRANEVGTTSCPGDFRMLTPAEIDIANSIEPEMSRKAERHIP